MQERRGAHPPAPITASHRTAHSDLCGRPDVCGRSQVRRFERLRQGQSEIFGIPTGSWEKSPPPF